MNVKKNAIFSVINVDCSFVHHDIVLQWRQGECVGFDAGWILLQNGKHELSARRYRRRSP